MLAKMGAEPFDPDRTRGPELPIVGWATVPLVPSKVNFTW